MMNLKSKPGSMVQTSMGKKRLDYRGSAIGASRMNPAEAYGAIPLLLQEYINTGGESLWQDIRQRIDKVYTAVSRALEALDAAEPFSADIKKLLKSGKKLFFKPNLVNLPAIDLVTHGPLLDLPAMGVPGSPDAVVS
jgi:hypothetical protein